MRACGRASRRVCGVAAAALTLLASPSLRAGESEGLPTVERVQLDEQAGRVEEALAGWATRATTAATPVERADALRRYVALASKHPAAADGWLTDAVSRTGAGIRVIAGRRVVVVAPEEAPPPGDAAVLAAQLDAYALAIERLAGARPLRVELAKTDKRPQDAAGRLVVGVWPIPKPVADQAFDAWRNNADPKAKGAGFAHDVAAAIAQSSLAASPNRRAQNLGPAVHGALLDLAARGVGDAAGVALCDEVRKAAWEAFEKQWAPGCLPAEAAPADTVMVHVFFAALETARAAGRDPGDALRAFLCEPRRFGGWSGRGISSGRELAFEPLAASMSPEALAVFRRAGVLATGPAFEDMMRRVAADDQCREADSVRGESEGTAARMFRAAADSLGDSLLREELVLEALSIEERTEAKKSRAAAKKLGLLEGFEFLGPLPDVRRQGEAPAAQRLMPLAVATANGRHPLKVKEPAEVSLKWDEVKEDVYDRLVQRTPWGDKRGTAWGGATVAAIKWTKDMGRVVRLRPCRDGWNDVLVLADGRPVARWPDGSSIVPGAKGTEILLASGSRITCSVPWRDARFVDDDIAAAAADKDAALALRPWASRRVAAALPAIAAALAKLSDAEFQTQAVLLAPYHGGDAATCDAMLAHAKAHPAVLGAYLDACRGTRDAAVLDRLVALAVAPDAAADVVTRVQAVLEHALFRKVTDKGPALTALWERGRKWLAATAAAEGEEVRDLIEAAPCFRAVAAKGASGSACLAPSGWGGGFGEGYLCLDVPEAPGAATLTVRWRASGAGRLTLRGAVTDGRKSRPFSIDAPPPAGSDGVAWTVDSFDIGAIPRGRVVLSFDDPCVSGCEIDSLAVGAKPLE